jgi:hypothetical protein
MSPKLSISKEELIKVGKGLVIAMAGAGLTYASSVVTSTDFGKYDLIVAALWSAFINFARMYVPSTK